MPGIAPVDAMTPLDIIIRFLLAALLSGVLGLERERKGRAAGLRTHVLVCLGATLAMVISDLIAAEWNSSGSAVWLDRGRIAAGVLTGVGFLGAGTIINVGGQHRGLTTAAMIWFAATLGIAVGAGFYVAGAIGTALALMTVVGLEKVESHLPSAERYLLVVGIPRGLERVPELCEFLRNEGFSVTPLNVKTEEETASTELTFEIVGRLRARSRVDLLLTHLQNGFPGIQNIECRRLG